MKRLTVAPHLLSVLLLLPGCTSSSVPDISPPPFTPQTVAPAPNAELAAIAEEVWKRTLEKEIGLRIKFGLPIESLPEVSHAAVKDAGFAGSILGRLRAIDPAPLNDERYLWSMTNDTCGRSGAPAGARGGLGPVPVAERSDSTGTPRQPIRAGGAQANSRWRSEATPPEHGTTSSAPRQGRRRTASRGARYTT